MNYQQHYDSLIRRAKSRVLDVYSEKHHIIPRCLGGDNSSENLVRLTAKEHFIAHRLLAALYPNHVGLQCALLLMARRTVGGNVKSSRAYAAIKEKVSALRKGRPLSDKHRASLQGCQRGATRSAEYKAKLSASRKGKKQSPEAIEARCKALRVTMQTPEYKAKMAAVLKRRVAAGFIPGPKKTQ